MSSILRAVATVCTLALITGAVNLVLGTRILLGIYVLVLGFLLYGAWPRLRLRHIPGPQPHLFIGNLPEISKYGQHAVQAEMSKKHGPVFKMWMGRIPFIIVCDPAAAQEIMTRSFTKFHARPEPPIGVPSQMDGGLFNIAGDRWKRRRSACVPMFGESNLSSLASATHDSIDRFITDLHGAAQRAETINLDRWVQTFALVVTAKSQFSTEVDNDYYSNFTGVRKEKHEMTMIEALNRFTKSLTTPRATLLYALSYVFPCLGRLIMRLDPPQSLERISEGTLDLMAKRKEAEEQGLGSVGKVDLLGLIQASKDKVTGDPLDEKAIIALSNTFLMAGYDTTAKTMSFCLYTITAYPQVLTRVVEEIDRLAPFGTKPTFEDLREFAYLDAVVHETVRMYPAVPLTFRTSDAESTVGGFTVPSGTNICVDIWGLHHNPKHFPEPDEFRPERFLDSEEAKARHPYAFLGFGGGPRNCIGQRFALTEIKLALIRIFQEMTFEFDMKQMTLPLEIQQGVVLGPKSGVFVNIRPRAAVPGKESKDFFMSPPSSPKQHVVTLRRQSM